MFDFRSASENSFMLPEIEMSPNEYLSPSSTSMVIANLFLFGVIDTSVETILKFK